MCKMSSGLRIIVNKGQDPLCKLDVSGPLILPFREVKAQIQKRVMFT